MSVARAKARKMAARFGSQPMIDLTPLCLALGRNGFTSMSAAGAITGMAKAYTDFERAYAEFRLRFVAGVTR